MRKKPIFIVYELKDTILFGFINIYLYMMIIFSFVFFASNMIIYDKDHYVKSHLPLESRNAFLEVVQILRKKSKQASPTKKDSSI